jgi:hypothetical protein
MDVLGYGVPARKLAGLRRSRLFTCVVLDKANPVQTALHYRRLAMGSSPDLSGVKAIAQVVSDEVE